MSRSSVTEQIGATIPGDLADALRELAQENERSFSAEVRLALRQWVARAKREEAQAAEVQA